MAASFRFKQFEVFNERSALKVGTDGVLLGAWAAAGCSPARILDVGTGTGVIALMMAQRFTQSTVTGIDIDCDSVEEAAANFASSPWPDRLEACLKAVQDWQEETDLIVSNPPFFINSLKAPDNRRSVARHTDTLQYRDLIAVAKRCLTADGRLAVIYSSSEAEVFAGEALSAGLFPVRICHVRTKDGKAPKRFLMELSYKRKEPFIEELSIQRGDEFSEEYRSLTRDFYLKF